MSEQKYVNLPGIDRTQPDVYETSDLPEDDQYLDGQAPAELSSESVEQLDVLPESAYQHFKGKTVEIGQSDFSDRIGRPRQTGYYVPRSEYELVGDRSAVKESVEQRYQRLQHELRELADDVNRTKEMMTADEAATSSSQSNVARCKQVEYLQQQMLDLNLEQQLQGAKVNLADPHGTLQKRLLVEVDALKSAGAKQVGDKPAAAQADSEHMLYQLRYRPEEARFSSTARLAELEQRLERLEALLGHSPEKITALNADLASKSLLTAVSALASRTKLLDPSQLDQVEARLAIVQQRLTQITEKKEVLEQTGKLNKVSELYDLVTKWEPVAASLPHITERLSALEQLHEQALKFSQTLADLETAQSQVSAHLKSHTDVVKQAQSAFAQNMTSVQANCDVLVNRLNALDK